MKMNRDLANRASRAALRIAIGPVIVWMVYWILLQIFAARTVSEGLVSPGAVDFGLLVLAASVLLLKIAVLFLLPPLIVYRASAAVLRYYRDRAVGRGIDPTFTGGRKAARSE